MNMNSLLHKNNPAAKPALLYANAKPFLQAKLTVNTPGDQYEQEADAMADRVMRMSSYETAKPVTGLIGKSLQRKCAHCEEEEKKKKPIMRKAATGNSGMAVSSSFAASLNASKGGGSPLPQGTRSFMENAFSTDFSGVKTHTGSQASEMSKRINARAFTYGNDIYFDEGQYNLDSAQGMHLLAHELTHTIQQSFGIETTTKLQRDLNDGHNLKSLRFSGDSVLEACYDNERYLSSGSRGPAVVKLQQALVDAGFPLLRFGVDGIFGSETDNAVRNFQQSWRVLAVDGIVGPDTMGALDAIFSESGQAPVCGPAPRAPEGGTAPLLTNPNIISRGLCRGACGMDCPTNCTASPDEILCLPDSSGTCHYTYTYQSVQQCGSHVGCRIHDNCYDICGADIYDSCHRSCDLDCFRIYGFQCDQWRRGNGPYDTLIRYSNAPIISAPISGPCTP